MKVKNDHRSKFSNLSNWKAEAWKKSGLQRDSNPGHGFLAREELRYNIRDIQFLLGQYCK